MTSFNDVDSVNELLAQNVAACGDRVAYTLVGDIDDGQTFRSLTYHDLDREARRVAAWLGEHVAPGSRILLLYPLGLEFISAFVGCMYADMIAVPAPLFGRFEHERRRARQIAGDADIAAIFTDAANHPSVHAWAEDSGLGHHPCIATDPGQLAALADPSGWRGSQAHRDTVMLLQYTSGSTGDPKGVIITHDNLLDNVGGLSSGLGLDESTRFGGWIPQYHDMGLMAQIMPTIMLRSSCALMQPRTFLMRPVHWLRLIDRFDVAYSAAPNFAYELCTRAVTDAQLEGLDLSRWVVAANGSEPVQASTLRAFTERFARVGFRPDALSPCYGMAEATVYVSGVGRREPVVRRVRTTAFERGVFEPCHEEQGTTLLCASGAPHGLDVRAVDPDSGVALPDGLVGEIWLRGHSVAEGYWRRPGATTATFGALTHDGEGPFLRTGDLGVRWEGDLFVTGRIKEMLIVHGRNVYPQDIEYEARAHHPELRSRFGAAFAVPGHDGVEVAVLVHEVKGRFAPERLAELGRAIKLTLARELGIRAAGVVLLRPGQVERTTSGKIQRSSMRARFIAGELDVLYGELDPQTFPAIGSTQP